MIETISAAFAAGETKTFNVSGEYFELTDANASGVTVLLTDRNGAVVTSIRNSGPGIYVKPGRYEIVQITSVAAQTIGWIVADGDAGTRRLSGVVSIADSINCSAVQATVTNASAQVLAANTARRYLLIQNKDPVGRLWLQFGAAANQAAGVLIVPGGNFEMVGKVSGQQIQLIGDLASNSKVTVVEG